MDSSPTMEVSASSEPSKDKSPTTEAESSSSDSPFILLDAVVSESDVIASSVARTLSVDWSFSSMFINAAFFSLYLSNFLSISYTN